MYSNFYCSCSFESEIIKIGQSFHKMYSNNILNFQESTTILNAHSKNVWHLVYIYIYIYIYNYIYIIYTYSHTYIYIFIYIYTYWLTSNYIIRHFSRLNFSSANVILSVVTPLFNVTYIIMKGGEINNIFLKNRIKIKYIEIKIILILRLKKAYDN